MTMLANRKDLGSGLFFIAVGMFYGGNALRNLPIGHALNMGPGYFPVVLSALLIGLGATILLRSFLVSGTTQIGIIAYRAIALVSLAIVVFALFLNQLGLFSAVFVAAVIAGLAKPSARPAAVLATGLAVAAFSTAVFGYGLKLHVPIVGTWFGTWSFS